MKTTTIFYKVTIDDVTSSDIDRLYLITYLWRGNLMCAAFYVHFVYVKLSMEAHLMYVRKCVVPLH